MRPYPAGTATRAGSSTSRDDHQWNKSSQNRTGEVLPDFHHPKEQLAGLFAIDIEFRAGLSNHPHVVLRTMPRVAKRWSTREVVRRWLTVTQLAKCLTDDMPVPNEKRTEELTRDAKLVAKLRRRLSAIPKVLRLAVARSRGDSAIAALPRPPTFLLHLAHRARSRPN